VLEQLRGFTDPASPMDASPRPSKRARLEEGEEEEEEDDAAQLWWNAVPGLVANGVPGISPSSSSPPKQRAVLVHTSHRSLLNVMNGNIKTMKRVRGTHAKFAALAATTSGEEVVEGEGGYAAGVGAGAGFGFTTGLAVEEDVLGEGDSIDERPWLARVECARERKRTSIFAVEVELLLSSLSTSNRAVLYSLT
jgi:transcriptional activator SPT7